MRIVIAGVLLVFLTGCWPFLASGSWRYRMTVEVETPEGLKTGSAVREVSVTESPRLTPEMTASRKLKGEAVAVDLGKRGVLFALLSGDDAYRVVYNAFPFEGAHAPEAIRYYRNLENVKAELKPRDYPLMVTFNDAHDPTSVKIVYASELNWQESKGFHKVYDVTDNFEVVFGKEVKLKRVWIEMTDDAVTKGVREWLPWLHEYRSKRLDGRRIETIEAENRLANSLGMGSFTAGYPAKWQLNQPSPAARRASPRPASE